MTCTKMGTGTALLMVRPHSLAFPAAGPLEGLGLPSPEQLRGVPIARQRFRRLLCE
ncbi:MAG: hypothetical protein ABI895_41735 [Deltaproteobacteria bacterium]